jgi:glycosyltransferase involved in cell wall biosynthesis
MAYPRFIVAQLGARMHYALPLIFHEAGMLERFYTDAYIGNKPWLERALGLVPAPLRPAGASRLLDRKEERIPPAKVTSFDAFGLRYARAQRRANGTAELTRIYADFGRRFCERIVARNPDADAIWAFDGAALELFRWARQRGIRCVLEQTLAPRQVLCRLLLEESERWPGWEPGLELPPGPDALAEREEEEWQLADRIVTGLSFVTDGIHQCGGPAHKCTVVAYGVDIARFLPAVPLTDQSCAGRLRVLFAGEVGLRKGTPYLLEALRQLGPDEVEARFAGRVALAPEKLAPYGEVATFLGPVPRSHMAALYRWADVLVMPSLSETGPVVVCEALAAGVYVITTPNARSVLSGDSAFGEIVPIRSVEAIAAALRRRRDIGPAARPDRSNMPPVSLGDYRDRLLGAVRSAL